MKQQIPAPDCTKDEAVAYLQQHIEKQDAQIEELTKALQGNEERRQLKAWAIDQASRFFDKTPSPDFKAIKELADNFVEYTNVQTQVTQ